jgi:hypothetical protein
MHHDHETFELTCIKKLESNAAVLIYDPASDEEVWIPLSQVDEMHFNPRGEGTIVMTAWIAKKKGLI